MDQSTNNTNYTNYFDFQNIPGMYGNQNIGINNIIMMTMAPIISTLFATIFQTFIQDLKTGIYNIFSFIYKQLLHYTNHYILFKLDTYNKIYITMYQKTMDYNGVGDNISTEALPIIWYLNNITMLKNNKLKIAKMINYSEMIKRKQLTFSGMGIRSGTEDAKLNSRINEKILFAPFPEKSGIQNLQSTSSNRQNDSINNNIPANTVQNEENMESIEIADNIFLDIKTETVNSNYTRESTETYLIIKSDKLSLFELKKFVIKITKEYEYLFELKKDKIYVYNGFGKFPQYGCYDLDKYQSFDNLFFSEKENILKDLKKFTSNADYYVKHGIKRKIGYLLHGLPGSGKTAIASAISRSLNRTPVYVPISRIQTNNELENILYIRKYNDTYFNTNETIFLLDELDSGRKEQKMIKKPKKEKKNNNNDDEYESDFESDDSKDNNAFNPTIVINNGNDKKDNMDTQIIRNDTSDEFNVGILLSMLDGNIDQDELVIIATTNDISKLDPAIYRDGRLKLIKIDYVGRTEIIQMIEHYYDIKLTEDQRELLCDNKTVPSLTVKNVCLQYVNDDSFDVNILIDKINDLYVNIDKNDIQKLSYNKKFPLLPPKKIKINNNKQRIMSNYYAGPISMGMSNMNMDSMNMDSMNMDTFSSKVPIVMDMEMGAIGFD